MGSRSCTLAIPSVIATGINPLGVNVYAGGTSGMEGAALPMFQNAITSSRGCTTGLNSTYANMNAAGWPDGSQASVTYILYVANVNAALALQYWFYDSGLAQYKTFKCGFTGSGAEGVNSASATIANVVQVGANTTFDLTPLGGINSLFSFTITGITVALSAIFANLPDYPTGLGQFTTEIVTHLSQFSHLRFMQLTDAWFNNQANTSATRNTPANTKARKDWYPGNFVPGFDGYPSHWFMQLGNACNNGIWLHWPPIDDGTYASAMLADAAATRTPGLKDYYEQSNELWNGTGTTGTAMQAQAALTDAATFTGTIVGTTLTVSSVSGVILAGGVLIGSAGSPTISSGGGTTWTLSSAPGNIGPVAMSVRFPNTIHGMYQYLGLRLHQFAAQARTAYGASRYLNDVRIVAASQIGGNGRTFFTEMLAYMTGCGFVPSDDIYMLSTAPYLNTSGSPSGSGFAGFWRSTFIATAGSGSSILTVTSGVTGTITAGDLVFNPQIPTGTTILAYGTSGTTGVGGTGTYALSAATTGAVPGGGINTRIGSNPTTHTIAQIQANLLGTDGLGNVNAVNTIIQTASTENILALAKWYGLRGGVGSYEGGYQVNSEIWMPNITNAVMDAGFQPVLQGLLAKSYDGGMSTFTKYEGGATGINSLTGSKIQDALDYNAASLLAGSSAQIKAMRVYFPGTYVPQRNLVNGPGSSFSATNWCDNVDGTTFPVMDTTQKCPPLFNVNGQIQYTLTCKQAGTYTLVVRFTNTSASAKVTNFVLDGVTLFSGLAIPGTGTNGGVNDVTIGAVPLTVGAHAIIFGDGLNSQANVSPTDLAGPANGIRWN